MGTVKTCRKKLHTYKPGNGLGCHQCHRIAARKAEAKWRAGNPDRVTDKRLFKTYGLALWEYKVLFKKQKGCCAICGKHQSKLACAMCVDHCHFTGKVRGLLCKQCNRALGFLNDDVKLVKKAAGYLLGAN